MTFFLSPPIIETFVKPNRGDYMGKEQAELDEDLVYAWVRLTAVLKNTRITQGMIYNEAIVMLVTYQRYRKDGEGLVSFKDIVAETKMLKSLAHRTIESLEKKGLLERCGGKDRRMTFVRPVKDRLGDFLEVHNRSLELAGSIRDLIGLDDAQAFVRFSEKIIAADPLTQEE